MKTISAETMCECGHIAEDHSGITDYSGGCMRSDCHCKAFTPKDPNIRKDDPMKPKITEPQALLLLILFIAFATIMLSRAHGAGGLGNGIRPETYQVKIGTVVTEYYDMMSNTHRTERYDYTVAGILFHDKEAAEDMAFALNDAHSKRLKPRRIRAKWMGTIPCCEDDHKAMACVACDSPWPAK